MKIAIVGTAPSYVEAPFNDPEWEIWTVSGLFNCGKRITRLYELHKTRDINLLLEKSPGYREFGQKLGNRFILQEANENYPDATLFNFEFYLKKHGPYFASSISWMIAEAMELNPTDIGLFGINMTHGSEYEYQRPSACYFLGKASERGIQLHLPQTSELLMVPVQYGYEDEPPIVVAMRQKKAEAIENMQIAAEQEKKFYGDKRFFEGIKESAEAFERSWIK